MPAISGAFWEQIRYFTLIGFLVVCLLGGGGSRTDVLSFLYLRPAAILCLAALLLSPGRWEFRPYRSLFLLLALFAATFLIQLIPLPPALWLSLPGHSQFAEAAAAAGFQQPWRPISLAPDFTLNSLLALLPCLVVLVGLAGIREDQRQSLLVVLIGFVCVNAIWSILQFVGGEGSWTYLYRITNQGVPVGFFANRNHHAVFLALAFPLLSTWLGTPTGSLPRRARLWIACGIGLLMIPAILASGSRAGLIIGAFSLVAAYWLAPHGLGGSRWGRRSLFLAAWALPLLLFAITVFFGRAISFDRLADASQIAAERRVAMFPVLMDMLKTYNMEGIGYGAFDPAFRVAEPHWALNPTYFNHAHNDLVELALTGGWLALIVLVLFLAWYVRRSLRVIRRGKEPSLTRKYARLGSVLVALILGASLVDYPLRTPLFAVLFTIACGWIAIGAPRRSPDGEGEEKDHAPFQISPIARFLVVIPLALGLGWLTMGVTAAATIGQAKPDAVQSWWPFDASVNASAAAKLIERRTALGEVETLARRSLAREPVNASASRSLALVAALRGHQGQAQRLMTYAEFLSRRDLPTELWLIESRVQANDIPGALVHYDRALRTNPEAGRLLYPILLSASQDPAILRPLASILAQRPPWWRDFVTRLVTEGRSPAAIETIVRSLRLDTNDTIEHGLQVIAIGRLIQLGSYDRAVRLYPLPANPGGQQGALVRNGGFETENQFPPIDWALSDGVDLAGIMQPMPGSGRGRVLSLVARNGTGGDVGRQLVLLRPGRYRFAATMGDVVGTIADHPEISLYCAGTNQTIFTLRTPVSPASGRRIFLDFTVPPTRCAAQWLTVRANGSLGVDSENPWIDSIALRPLASARNATP